ncbi:hypothetical protein CHH28_10980 [Bacterioplanes sanyensis]|uniref:Uncharacterized protein n=1 Tax=Bacterioplanes sanyensis TaxID=1249553 RepID=A0A222FK96_9GAMM|nr:hypothetical protein [Bacterioplanes sanyensis]ASP39169.1 hypothetical protein CHH28_10980 [Bacterioplanes sanyensis]
MTRFLLLLMLSGPALANLEPLTEEELSASYGQAIFELNEQLVNQGDGSQLNMTRLTMGARIEINANIEELSLGRYWRPEGTNCSGGPGGDKVCYNNVVPESYDDNINWACTAKPCGSVGLPDENYLSSALTHDTGGEKSFFTFPGGYRPDGGVDVKLRDLTLGQVRDKGNGQYELLPFVQENPYIEFAFDETGASRKLVGFRIGAEDAIGYQGNIIDVISGFIRPNIVADVEIEILGIKIPLGSIRLEASLGGVRTIGWLDEKTLDLYDVEGAAALLVSNPAALLEQSPHAQLYPVQSNYLEHTEAFFFSAGTRAIQWSKVGTYKPEMSRPGFWINLGGDGGLKARTQQGDHPMNYFPGHPKHNLYSGSENYGNVNTLPSWSQTYNN